MHKLQLWAVDNAKSIQLNNAHNQCKICHQHHTITISIISCTYHSTAVFQVNLD